MLLWAMLLGGVLERFARPQWASGAASFIRSSGRYFLRFVRLALLSAPLYYVVYRLYATGNERLADWTRDVTTERTVLFYSLILAAITALLLVAVHTSFAYAKIATAGLKSTNTKYHFLSLIRSKSNERPISRRTAGS